MYATQPRSQKQRATYQEGGRYLQVLERAPDGDTEDDRQLPRVRLGCVLPHRALNECERTLLAGRVGRDMRLPVLERLMVAPVAVAKVCYAHNKRPVDVVPVVTQVPGDELPRHTRGVHLGELNEERTWGEAWRGSLESKGEGRMKTRCIEEGSGTPCALGVRWMAVTLPYVEASR